MHAAEVNMERDRSREEAAAADTARKKLDVEIAELRLASEAAVLKQREEAAARERQLQVFYTRVIGSQ